MDLHESNLRRYPARPPAASHAAIAALRVGLGQLKDARKDLVEAVIAEREAGGPFRGFRDFLQRTQCRFEDVRVLYSAGKLARLIFPHLNLTDMPEPQISDLTRALAQLSLGLPAPLDQGQPVVARKPETPRT